MDRIYRINQHYWVFKGPNQWGLNSVTYENGHVDLSIEFETVFIATAQWLWRTGTPLTYDTSPAYALSNIELDYINIAVKIGMEMTWICIGQI